MHEHLKEQDYDKEDPLIYYFFYIIQKLGAREFTLTLLFIAHEITYKSDTNVDIIKHWFNKVLYTCQKEVMLEENMTYSNK